MLQSNLNAFAASELSDDALSMVHAGHGGGGGGKPSKPGKGGNVFNVSPVFNINIAFNIATVVGNNNIVIQGISFGTRPH